MSYGSEEVMYAGCSIAEGSILTSGLHLRGSAPSQGVLLVSQSDTSFARLPKA